ncbi:MAG: T9SS type A sorting domain-containing protein [Phycisphaerae bacterium]|nr:T9SS type A sorting domain-containing protein [Saprospiraceae bacterium]
MKTFCTFFAIFLLAATLFGQANDLSPDTLLQHTFEGLLDPADSMLPQPTGDDIQWVNYDQDNKKGLCVSNGITPKGWYWESDLGFSDPNMADNYAFTSCSFLDPNGSLQNKNWLITSPVYIPDSTYWLCWRSLSYYGPDFMDGYRVLVSTSTNLPSGFTDTLFSAAQTVDRFVKGSLDLNDYLFSPGYIHANGYTDTAYFFIDTEPLGDFYHGKLEPHSVSLANYAEQNIYIAFFHDSYDDFQLQVDDILVTNTKVSASIPSNFVYFNVLPNPVHDFAFVNWKTQTPQAGHLSVVDQSGRIVFEKEFNARAEGQIHLDAQGFAPGIYYCKLQTATGQATKMLVKM